MRRTRFDSATLAGRPFPLVDKTNVKAGFLDATPTSYVYKNNSEGWDTVHIWINNTTASDRTWTCYIVPDGGDKEAQWAVRTEVPLQAKESINEPHPFTLESGDELWLEASADNSVTAFINVEKLS